MENYLLFIDGSASPQLKTGFGVYLFIPEKESDGLTEKLIKEKIKIKRFENTSSTRLELEILIWALKEIQKLMKEKLNKISLNIYSDSQNIIRLPNRRKRFEENNYLSLGKNIPLKNADLYKEFFKITDKINCSLIKVAGHTKYSKKNSIDKIFSVIDKTSRKTLRDIVKNPD